MAKSLTRQTFGEPSHRVLELNETSDEVARLSEAGYAYKSKLQELEHQFEVKASKLREEYIAEALEIHTADGRMEPQSSTFDGYALSVNINNHWHLSKGQRAMAVAKA